MSKDTIGFYERATVYKSHTPGPNDGITWTCDTRIEKYASEQDYLDNNPYEVAKIHGNTALNNGLNLMWKLVSGQGGTDNYFLDATNTYIGVGNSSAAAIRTQSGLLGSSRAYRPMDQTAGITYPMISDNVITFRAKFGPTEGNFAWNEWGVLNGNPDNPGRTIETVIQMNRKVEPMGTKEAGDTWVIVCDISLNPL